eukprot:gene25385-31841_t
MAMVIYQQPTSLINNSDNETNVGTKDVDKYTGLDVQELTRVLFDALEESFKGTEVENIIDELYAGELIDYLRCIDVDHESERKDKFLDFSLAIVPFGSNKAMHSLTECIEMFLRPEILSGDNKYYAEKFDRKVDALKGLKFGRLPQIMSVQLKRFVYDFSGADVVQKKLNDVVKFPMVLDMNKYVATRRGTGDVFEPNEEFEAFLREQMEILGAETKRGEAATQSAVAPSPSSSSSGDYEHFQDVEMAAANPLPLQEEEEELKAADEDMPPLVDYTNARAPDQVVADAAQAEKETARAREKVMYGSMDREAVRVLLDERGEWIYELYAVLIHSGAISGGHYYAYIKDLESQRWQNFNDSSVSPIDEQTVQQAWGETVNVSNYASSYSGMNPLYNRVVASSSTAKTTRLSSANAYMLMYRQVTAATLGLVSYPSADSVPQYIQELVQAEETRRAERLREEEERRNKLTLKVWWEDKEYSVATSRVALYKDFLRDVWTQLNLGPHLMEQDSIHKGNNVDCESGGESGGRSKVAEAPTDILADTAQQPLYNRFRLRLYNQHSKSKAEALDVEESGDKTLHELNLTEYKALAVETRTSSLEEYEVFYKDGLSLLVDVFQPQEGNFGASRSVRLPRGCVVGDLKAQLAVTSPYPVERMQLFKLVPLGPVDARMEVLSDDSRKLREDLHLYEGFKLYLEETPPEDTASPAWLVVMRNRSKLNVLVNKPPGVACDLLVEADMRWKVSDLRAKILERLELEPTVDIRLFKASSRGQELREDGLSLSSNAVYAGMNIFVSMGKALRVGVHQLCVMQYTATEGRAGVVALPPLEQEEEEVLAGARSTLPLVSFPSSGTNSDVKKGWDTKAKQDLDGINEQSGPFSALGDQLPPPPTLVFPDASASCAASTAAHYRVCGRRDEAEERESDGDVTPSLEEDAERGMVMLASDPRPAFHENIHNLVHTTELTVLQGADGLYGHAPIVEGEPVLMCALDEERPLDNLYNAPIVLSDSHVNLISPDTVACVIPDEQVVVCDESAADSFEQSDAKRSEVEPSGFGELTVKNQQPVSVVFESLEVLGEICVETNTPVAELRQTLLDRLIAAGKLPAGSSPRLIRLRDKVGSNPGKVLRDGRTLGESKVYLFDQKSLAVQLLDAEEDLTVIGDDSDLGDALIYIQRWRRSTWSMGERFEVLLRGGMTVRDVARALGRLTNIHVDSMLALVIPRDSELYLSELQMKSPTRNYGRGWFCPGKERKPLKFMSHELKVQDGDLLVLQDITEPLMELSPADLRSVAIVEAAGDPYSGSNIDYSYPVPFGPQPSYLPNFSMSVGSGTGAKSGASTGVKIKTHQERLRESEKQQAEAANPADDVEKSSAVPLFNEVD